MSTTPGPWTLNGPVFAPKPVVVHAPGGRDTVGVVEVDNPADLRLILAAPEMLAFLRKATRNGACLTGESGIDHAPETRALLGKIDGNGSR